MTAMYITALLILYKISGVAVANKSQDKHVAFNIST